ncbi:hypothetical protein BJ684DRAFT_21203 [Piptocephalis cylindrospora]|uniref:PH domain-containing protein n=1 Tax=Piptocephalis cylindrospora TaxID=1907219 RepID=A0A4P9Y2G5_9FUNG|nr:hypothetical protein BJ684DRAFT_21203 [Piptocephalis cylindrospora]|eukprot:RKP12241.1 hypothetical protein BJ684DRAFT_21203 [Piptocephalis cylindrospora]
MSRVGQEVVETIRETENQQRILDIQAALVGFHGNLVTNGRRYVHHGTLIKVSRSGTNESRVCFLFDDLLVWCKPSSKGQYLFRGKIDLRRCEVFELRDGDIQLVEGQEPYHLRPLSSVDRHLWLSHLRATIDACARKRKEAAAISKYPSSSALRAPSIDSLASGRSRAHSVDVLLSKSSAPLSRTTSGGSRHRSPYRSHAPPFPASPIPEGPLECEPVLEDLAERDPMLVDAVASMLGSGKRIGGAPRRPRQRSVSHSDLPIKLPWKKRQ